MEQYWTQTQIEDKQNKIQHRKPKKVNNTDPTKYREGTQVLVNGKQFLFSSDIRRITPIIKT